MLSPLTSLLLASVRRVKRGGIVLNGHTLSRGQARFQLEVLGRWFEFIGLDELPHRMAQPGERPFCLLTFDDGKRSHYTEIAPELERQGVPAVFYVTTDLLSTGECLWFDRRDLLVRRLGRCPAGLELQTLKRLPFEILCQRLEHACAQHGFAPENCPDDFRPMSWENARDLARRGFTIGAHGRTHAILTGETRERAGAEIEDSLAAVSSELGTPCRTFAFPNGNYTLDLAHHASRHGAATVMTTDPLWVDGGSLPWRLPRVQLFAGFSRARIELKLALAAVRGSLTNPNGTGRSYWRLERQCRASAQLWHPA